MNDLCNTGAVIVYLSLIHILIGHRNPDTDSICSAICYANLKQAVTGEEYMPARAGHVNGETQFVLDLSLIHISNRWSLLVRLL